MPLRKGFDPFVYLVENDIIQWKTQAYLEKRTLSVPNRSGTYDLEWMVLLVLWMHYHSDICCKRLVEGSPIVRIFPWPVIKTVLGKFGYFKPEICWINASRSELLLWVVSFTAFIALTRKNLSFMQACESFADRIDVIDLRGTVPVNRLP